MKNTEAAFKGLRQAWVSRLGGRQPVIGCSQGLQEVPVFVQERGRQSIQLLPKFLHSLVLLLLLPHHLLPVIVDVEVHPVVHHSHHGFFRDSRIREDLGGRVGLGWGRSGFGKGDHARPCDSGITTNSDILFSLICITCL